MSPRSAPSSDVGVHQDGLVHISAMANAYVKDPRTIAKPGDVVRVKVLEVDPKRRRISLTLRLDEASQARPTTAPAGIAPTGAKKTPPARRDTFGAPAIPRPPAATRWPRRFGERGWRVRSQADNSGGLPSSQLKWPPACDSLINRITSLMVRFNSLLGRNKFPVPLRRELPHKLLQ